MVEAAAVPLAPPPGGVPAKRDKAINHLKGSQGGAQAGMQQQHERSESEPGKGSGLREVRWGHTAAYPYLGMEESLQLRLSQAGLSGGGGEYEGLEQARVCMSHNDVPCR